MNSDTGHPPSLWAATAPPPPSSPPLDGDIEAHAIVVGAGYTGCSTALHLAERGVDVVLLEALEIGSGAAGRSMGAVNPHFRTLPSRITEMVGADLGERMNREFGAGADLVFDLVSRHRIECEASRRGTMEVGESARGLHELRAYQAEHAAQGAPVEWLDAAQAAALSGAPRYTGGYFDRRAGSIQPLAYVRGLARAAQDHGAKFHTRSRVISIASEGGRWRVKTARGSVRAERVVVATDAYSDDLMPDVRAAMFPMWANIVATEPLSDNLRATILPGVDALGDTQIVRQYFRTDRDGRLIVATLGRMVSARLSPLRSWGPRAIRKAFPHLGRQPIVFHWEGMLGMSRDFLPSLHEPAPGFHVPHGFSGRGITSGTVLGKHLAARVAGAPDNAFPLPVRPAQSIRFRGMRAVCYEAALRAGQLLAMVR